MPRSSVLCRQRGPGHRHRVRPAQQHALRPRPAMIAAAKPGSSRCNADSITRSVRRSPLAAAWHRHGLGRRQGTPGHLSNRGIVARQRRVVVRTARVVALSRSQGARSSIRSTGGGPSRVDSALAAAVKVPVVISGPLSPRPAIAPRKSRTALEQIVEILTVDMNGNFKRIFHSSRLCVDRNPIGDRGPDRELLIRPVPRRDNPFGPFVGWIAA